MRRMSAKLLAVKARECQIVSTPGRRVLKPTMLGDFSTLAGERVHTLPLYQAKARAICQVARQGVPPGARWRRSRAL